MIIVDDQLSIEALAGRAPEIVADGPVTTTWSFHYRLVRAVSDPRRRGRLTRATPDRLLAQILDPPARELMVLDPRAVTAEAAELAVRHGLNVLAAELLASAIHHGAPVVLASRNVGRRWPELFETEGARLDVRG